DAVSARADDDAAEVDAVMLRERGSQRERPAVRVAVELERDALHRLERSREGWERPLVRRELHDPVEPELPLHLLDRLAGRVRRDPGERPAEALGAHPCTLPRLARRQNRSAPPTAASAPAAAPPVLALGTASEAFRFTARFPAFTTSQPTRAFRLLTMLMS